MKAEATLFVSRTAPPGCAPGGAWGTEWPPKAMEVLKDRPVLKRYVLAGSVHAINFGRVVGCAGHFFEVLYQDGYHALLGWHDLRAVPVPHADDGVVARPLAHPRLELGDAPVEHGRADDGGA